MTTAPALGRFSDDELNDIRQREQLSAVFERLGIRLRRAGRMQVCLCPMHAENTPSCQIEDGKGLWHCLGGETEVTTWEGTRTIASLAGGVHRVLTRGGRWVDAPFRSYGVQPLHTIALSRNGVRKTIRATAGHRWFVRTDGSRYRECTTLDLRPGHRLEPVAPPLSIDRQHPDLMGIRHGYVFGDGTATGNQTHAYISGRNREYMPAYFAGLKFYDYPRRLVYPKQPAHWKELPTGQESDEYLLGFVAGLLVADGSVSKDGLIVLYQADRAVLEFVRDVCTRLGIVTSSIAHSMRSGFGLPPSPLYRVHFKASTLTDAMILDPRGRVRLANAPNAFERVRWTVVSVGEPGPAEEVYCAEVDGEHAFALADGILTGNCKGCGAGGDVINAVMQLRGCTFPEAVEYLGGVRELTEADRAEIARRAREQEERARAAAQRALDAARRTWAQGQEFSADDRSNPVVLYLEGRGLRKPQGADLRFAPALAYWGFADPDAQELVQLGVFPAMLGAIRNTAGDLIGVHRTYLDAAEHTKLKPPGCPLRNRPKKITGEQRGGSIALGPRRPRMAYGEGIESTLSWPLVAGAAADGYGLAALVSLGNIAGGATAHGKHPFKRHASGRPVRIPNGQPDTDRPGFVPGPDVREAVILGDGDSEPLGTRAALATAVRRWEAAGCVVHADIADDGLDFNDMLDAGL